MKILPLGLAFAAFSAMLAPAARAQCVAPREITGVWHSDDGGTYVVRRVTDNVVWWLGRSGDGGKTWTNVFRGVIAGNVINGEWADVLAAHERPNGGIGTLQLKIIGAIGKGVDGFEKIGATGAPFGGSKWSMSCQDTN